MRSWDVCWVSFTLCHQLLSFPCCRTGCRSNFYAFRKLKKKSDILVLKIDSRAQLICTCLVGSRRLWGWKTTWKLANYEAGQNLWASIIKGVQFTLRKICRMQEFRNLWDTHWQLAQHDAAGTKCSRARGEPPVQQPWQQHQLTGNITKLVCAIKPGISSLGSCSDREQLGCLITQFDQILCMLNIFLFPSVLSS